MKKTIYYLCVGLLCLSFASANAQQADQTQLNVKGDENAINLLPGKYQMQADALGQDILRAKGGVEVASPATYNMIDVFQPGATLWDQTQWPNPQINFAPGGVNIPVGDLTGDGVIDMIRVYNNVADERTSDINDLVNKTLVFLGGNTTTDPDFIIYEALFAAGDVTGDGRANLYATGEFGEARLYTFTSNSFTEEVLNTSAYNNDLVATVPLNADLNGNGFPDAAAFDGNTLRLRFGSDNPNNVSGLLLGTRVFFGGIHPDFNSTTPGMLAGVIEKDGETYLALIIGISGVGPYAGRNLVIVSLDQSGSLTLEQVVNIPSSNLINGNFSAHGHFFAAPAGSNGETMYFYSNQNLTEDATLAEPFNTIAFSLSSLTGEIVNPNFEFFNTNRLWHAGDLDGDGNPEFVAYNTVDDIFEIISYDTANEDFNTLAGLPFSTYQFPQNRYYGDQTNDGGDNFFIAFNNPVDGIFGQRMISYDGTNVTFDEITYTTADHGRVVAERVFPLGDVTGNGSDDFAVQYISGLTQTLALHEGGSDWETPIQTWDLEPRMFIRDVVSGYFTDMNRRDLAVLVMTPNPATNISAGNVFFLEGGSSPGEVPYLNLPNTSIFNHASANELTNVPGVMEAIGDVNNNGYDDIIFSGTTLLLNGSYLPLALYYGGPGLSDGPADEYITFSDPGSFGPGGSIKALGDFNDDGIDDFMVINIAEGQNEDFQQFGVQAGGRAHIFYGQSGTPDFSTPDITLQADTTQLRAGISYWFLGMNEVGVGDFNGDGNLDLAITPFRMHIGNDVNAGVPGIHIFHGADIQNGITQPAQLLPVWADYHQPMNQTGNFIGFQGRAFFAGIPDINGDGADELLFIPGSGLTNAALYLGGSTMAPRPAALYEAPNYRNMLASTGNFINIQYRSTVGDFNGDGTLNFLTVQPGDPNFRTTPIYMYDLTPPQPVSANDYISDLPERTALAQNFPNPFNPTTTIRYELSSDSHVTLEVFDLLGRSIGKLVNGRMEAGEHSVQFDAAHLSSGVYLYRLNAGGAVYTRKMMLVK